MKREFLKSLGIEDKEVIDKIMDENSSDIGRAKGELETYKNKVTELETDIKAKATEIETLKKSSGNIDELNAKITQLEADKTKLTTELDTKVNSLQKQHAIENGVRDAKAKNVKAVMALLDMNKINYTDGKLEGLSDQLDALTKDEGSSFLFGESNGLAGTVPGNPANNGGGGTPPTSRTLAEAIAKSLGK